MPEKTTLERARRKRRAGKAPSTQAGEFVREEMRHVRQGKHGVRSREQAVAIGLSKARRAGVPLEAPEPGRTSSATRRKAKSDLAKGRSRGTKRVSATRSRATKKALKREGKPSLRGRSKTRRKAAPSARRKRPVRRRTTATRRAQRAS